MRLQFIPWYSVNSLRNVSHYMARLAANVQKSKHHTFVNLYLTPDLTAHRFALVLHSPVLFSWWRTATCLSSPASPRCHGDIDLKAVTLPLVRYSMSSTLPAPDVELPANPLVTINPRPRTSTPHHASGYVLPP
eukprot:752644-Hanusia_phi.AAC.2